MLEERRQGLASLSAEPALCLSKVVVKFQVFLDFRDVLEQFSRKGND